MKTKLVLIAIAAVMLLSFTVIKSATSKSTAKVDNEQKGFAMQDENQF